MRVSVLKAVDAVVVEKIRAGVQRGKGIGAGLVGLSDRFEMRAGLFGGDGSAGNLRAGRIGHLAGNAPQITLRTEAPREKEQKEDEGYRKY